jgi:hypothetical protein
VSTPPFPDGRRFAFTIIDDTDVATHANVAPVYDLLEQLGLRVTKTVWPCACPEGSRDFAGSETLEDPAYREFVAGLARRGFEIALHGATMETSPRERTLAALDRFRTLFGTDPAVHANHAYNRENLYWGVERLDDPLLRVWYRWVNGRPPGYYDGHRPGSPHWWGDVCRERITYVRNLTFSTLDVTAVNPSLPYHDPRRPYVRWWFSAADCEDAREFVGSVTPAALDRLEARGGVCIIATHFGKGFAPDGRVAAGVRRALEEVARRPGWFVPVGTLLDWLRARRPVATLPPAEWRRMQWRWAWDLVRRRLRRGGRG